METGTGRGFAPGGRRDAVPAEQAAQIQKVSIQLELVWLRQPVPP